MNKLKKIPNAFVNGFKNYRKHTKDMSFIEKLGYIKDYYLKSAIVIGVIVCCIVSILVTSFINRHTDYILFGVAVNIDLSTSGTEYINDDFFKLHKTKGRQKIDYSCINIDNFETVDDAEASYYSSQSVVAQVGAVRLDYLLLDEVAFQHFASQEIYMDLNDILSKEEMKKFADKIVYVQEEGKEEMMPAGINITDTDFIKDNLIIKKDVFLSFAGNAPNKELAYEFFHYILEYKS